MQCWMARRINQIVFGIAFGSLYNGAAVSLEQMLIDADLWREAGRFFQGLDVADLEDSFEVIRRVGPGGNFLTDEQTARLMRTSEVYYSPLANREGDRGPGMLERAHRRVERMLSGPSYHAADAIAEEISRYVSERSAALIGEA
jgi:trimethylamine:corrinoid methyltransferase-like protein